MAACLLQLPLRLLLLGMAALTTSAVDTGEYVGTPRCVPSPRLLPQSALSLMGWDPLRGEAEKPWA
jgi:hypothetical protein